MTAMYFYAWKKGLKTGQYYLRSRRVVSAKKITITSTSTASDPTSSTSTSSTNVGGLQRSARGRRRQEEKPQEEDIPACKRDNPECTSCGS